MDQKWTFVGASQVFPVDVYLNVVVNDQVYLGYIYKGQREVLFCMIENIYGSTHINDEVIEANRISRYQPVLKPNYTIEKTEIYLDCSKLTSFQLKKIYNALNFPLKYDHRTPYLSFLKFGKVFSDTTLDKMEVSFETFMDVITKK